MHTRKKPISEDIRVEELARKTEEFTGADIEVVCNRAALLAIKEFDRKNNDLFPFEIKYSISSKQ